MPSMLEGLTRAATQLDSENILQMNIRIEDFDNDVKTIMYQLLVVLPSTQRWAAKTTRDATGNWSIEWADSEIN
jgi:hypothetical protein